MILTEDEIMKKSSEYSEANSKDPLQRTCLQQGYADGWADCQQKLQQAPCSTQLPPNVELKDIKAIRNHFGEHDVTVFEHRAFDIISRLINHFEANGRQLS